MTSADSQIRHAPWSVLIVDDEYEALTEMRDMISRSGYSVLLATSVDHARSILSDNADIGVVVTDIRMPGASGLELLKELSERQGQNVVRTIIVTGYGSFETVVEALRNRAFDFLSKPLTRDALMLRIEVAMSEIAYLRGQDNIDALALKNILRKRETRASVFGNFEYTEAAWDILIELTAARLEGRRLDVSGLCLLTHVSRTTAWRTIQSLVSAGMLSRVEDPEDRRRVHIELADHIFLTVRDFARSGAV